MEELFRSLIGDRIDEISFEMEHEVSYEKQSKMLKSKLNDIIKYVPDDIKKELGYEIDALMVDIETTAMDKAYRAGFKDALNLKNII